MASEKENILRRRRAAVLNLMEGTLKTAEREKRDLTPDEENKYQVHELECDELDEKIKAAQGGYSNDIRIAERKARSGEYKPAFSGLDDGGFRNLGEFFHTVARNPGDERLQELRAQTTKDGTSGGFAVPPQFANEFLQVAAAPAIIRPRATVLPAGSPPDSEISIPALDQRASQGASHMFGGVQIFHTGESDQLTESAMRQRQVKLKPNALTGYMTSSNELLSNWDAASAVIPQLLRGAVNAQEDYDFLRGNGVNQALGVLESPAAINIARATASQIGWADIRGMLSRLRTVGGQPVWVASQTTMGQLVQIADASSHAIWQPNAAVGLPPTLYGYPVLFHDRSPALGSKGDLMLADFKGYLVKDGSGPFIAVSEHFRFMNNETAFRIVWHVDGQGWLNSPIALEGSTANTVSPFVILDTP